MSYTQNIIAKVKAAHPHENEFISAVEEVLSTLEPILKANPKYEKHAILERLVIPDRQIHFRINWIDDEGKVRTNNGLRVQFNQAIGPYKGGLRFHPSVNPSIIKFLGFEQIFKNSLTTLAIGGAKGGSDFDPKGKSDREVLAFCKAFMQELFHHIGPSRDVPAGDIGVGAREIGFLYGEYKRLTRQHTGVLTGKGLNWGGSLLRKEATGYGVVYMAQNMLEARGDSLDGKKCAVSGSGNVAIYTIEKLQALGAKVLTCSDSTGMIYDESGIDVALLKEIKEVRRGRVSEYAKTHTHAKYTPASEYKEGTNGVFGVPCDAAFPSATQNELSLEDAKTLLKNGCICVSEGANMPSSMAASLAFIDAKIAYAPAKVANAGGVATSELEMSQNAAMLAWDSEMVDKKLKLIMKEIFENASCTAKEFKADDNLLLGGNIAGFKKIADTMIDLGV